MPNLNDIANIADSLQKPLVFAIQERCSKVRNRNSTCAKCMDVCAVGAIEVANNEVSYSPSTCVGCGACVAACPVEALVFLDPADGQLLQAVESARESNSGQALVACARISSKHVADPEKYAEVPCLARIDESFLLSQAADGATGIELVDGGCDTCKYGWCDGSIQHAIDGANGILKSVGSGLRVGRGSAFPQDVLIDSPEGRFGATRRGFFSDTADMLKETTISAARVTINEKLGPLEQEKTFGERMRVGEGGTLEQFRMPRHERAIDSIDMLGMPRCESFDTDLFGAVSIDVRKCNACGMCAMFCPTGALARGDSGKRGKALTALEFLACDCVQCGLCADVCWKDCLTLDSAVPTEQLFDFEPVVFDLSPERPVKH